MDYQDRVREEFNSLKERLDRLTSFVDKSELQDLHSSDRALLSAQQSHMRDYLRVLELRIARF